MKFCFVSWRKRYVFNLATEKKLHQVYSKNQVLGEGGCSFLLMYVISFFCKYKTYFFFSPMLFFFFFIDVEFLIPQCF